MKNLLRFTAFFVVLLASFVFGFGWRDIRQGKFPSPTALASLVDTALGAPTQSSPSLEFTQAYDRIKHDYYKPVPSDKLTYAGMEGLMAALGDPHTMFLEPSLSADFNVETQGNFVGIGARLAPDPLGAKVVSVFDNGPAEKVGIKEGDTITAINGKSVVGADIDDIVAHIRGGDGTPVKLELVRSGKPSLTVTPIRAYVTTPTVTDVKVVPGTQIGYFAVASFSEPTAQQFEEAVAKIEKSHIRGLVIDLRGNPGGLLETAKDMLSMFVANKQVVKMRFRDGSEEEVDTEPNELHHFTYPVAILIDEDSASAAEIFSGVLQDYKLATLVGTHSYGKTSVQNVIPLVVGGSSAKITIARYYLPRGTDFGRKVDDDGQYITGGLTPDVKVDLTLDKQVTFGDVKTDNQLQKAVQVLQAKQG